MIRSLIYQLRLLVAEWLWMRVIFIAPDGWERLSMLKAIRDYVHTETKRAKAFDVPAEKRAEIYRKLNASIERQGVGINRNPPD